MSQMVQTLPNANADLPRVREYTPKATTTSLELAYDLFENPDAEADIIDRNDISHPGFILGGTTLEVVDVGSSS